MKKITILLLSTTMFLVANLSFSQGFTGWSNISATPLAPTPSDAVVAFAQANYVSGFAQDYQELLANPNLGIIKYCLGAGCDPTSSATSVGMASNFSGGVSSGQNDISGTIPAQPDGTVVNWIAEAQFTSGTQQTAVQTYTVAVLSTDSFSLEQSKLSPNPANSEITLSNLNLDINNISIFNILGARVISTTDSTIDVSGLKQGVYLMKISAGDATAVKRFVKQ